MSAPAAHGSWTLPARRRIAVLGTVIAVLGGGFSLSATDSQATASPPTPDRAAVSEAVAGGETRTNTQRRVWRHTRVNYGARRWYDKPEPGVRCAFWNENRCRWFYNDYPLNRLDASSPAPGVQILWVRPTGVPVGSTYVHRHRSQVRAQIRAAASVFAASVGGNLNPTRPAHKRRDRSPRFVTVDVPTRWGTRYEARIQHVTVPPAVMFRHPLQARNGAETTQRGLMPYLEEHGFDQPNRRYLLLVDYTSFPRARLRNSYLWNAGNAGGAAAINMQSKNILWGPYGTGQQSDVDTSPHASNFANRGGVAAYINLFKRQLARLFSPRHDDLAFLIAHEFGHTLGQNILSPNFSADLHFRDREDILGDTAVLRNQCGPRHDQAKFMARFDCARDDYWGQIGVHGKKRWTRHRWDSSNSQYLWGAPQPPRQMPAFSLAQVGIDCVYLGWCEEN